MQARRVPVSIREHFLADHRQMEELFDEVLAAVAANDRRQMLAAWSRFESTLNAHMEAEEVELIPLVRVGAERDARVLIQEHAHIRRRMAELGIALELHTMRLDAMRSFIDELRAHARSEDRLLYKWADAHVAETDAEEIVDAMHQKRRRRPSLRDVVVAAGGNR